ncbi:MAG: DNA polymerase III subunit [Dehalococcoidia bacterium]|nr:DNA polymerase III subunit [Dehalococcoidia bacterium]
MWRLVGQDTARKTMERAVEHGVISHSYFFAGPKGVGKATAAVEFAAALNCREGAPPCLDCGSCRRILDGVHPDVLVVGDEGRLRSQDKSRDTEIKELGIDKTREMQHWAGLLPFEGRFRVFVIVECERLSEEAASSLLKVIEEPPPHVVFILTSRLEETVLPTIRSRCQRVPFTHVPASEIATLLEERFGLPVDESRKLARQSFGTPGWAVTAVQEPHVADVRERRLKDIEAMARGGLLERFRLVARMDREFKESRTEVYDSLDLMIEWWRELLLRRLDLPSEQKEGEEPPVFEDGSLRVDELTGFIHKIVETKSLLADNVNPQLALESLMTAMPRL